MKLKFALLAVGIPLLALGGEGLYHAARNRQQVPMSCEQFVRQRPPELWLRLSACDLDYDTPGYRESNGRIAEIFFPVRAVRQPKSMPAPLLVATSDPDALAIVQATIGDGRQPDQEAVTVMMLRVVTLLKASREIEGVARAGLFELLQTKRSLQSFPVPLDAHYVVIDLHARPQVVVFGIEAGVGLLALLLFLVAGRGRAKALPAEPAVEAPATPVPVMLLLNLDRAAGTEAIEHAPPLGSREETIAALRRALGDIRFEDGGRGTFTRPDFTIEIDLGVHDPVWAATVRASGAGAKSALRALAGTTGWRLYVPKRGIFMDGIESPEQDERRFGI